ncbi:hypothetical protein K491DRAFT_682416 [Lophiostoma macrostomum CBS 122681]|uniref:Uncharacterized protein n=1 Tax=Lophiostoma macrostomum CBS 122681 TaxID=1314788 RepID=A0A6A6SW07_9PLEO|nr:hypothetical protein K491DRAFT_682416 [Lophiostoma macrostomum CBS 122681]
MAPPSECNHHRVQDASSGKLSASNETLERLDRFLGNDKIKLRCLPYEDVKVEDQHDIKAAAKMKIRYGVFKNDPKRAVHLYFYPPNSVFDDSGRLICAYVEEGRSSVTSLTLADARAKIVPDPAFAHLPQSDTILTDVAKYYFMKANVEMPYPFKPKAGFQESLIKACKQVEVLNSRPTIRSTYASPTPSRGHSLDSSADQHQTSERTTGDNSKDLSIQRTKVRDTATHEDDEDDIDAAMKASTVQNQAEGVSQDQATTCGASLPNSTTSLSPEPKQKNASRDEVFKDLFDLEYVEDEVQQDFDRKTQRYQAAVRKLDDAERAFDDSELELENVKMKQSEIWERKKRLRERLSADGLRQFQYEKRRSAVKRARRDEE